MSSRSRFQFSRHAKNRMRRLGLRMQDVIAVVEQPENVTPSARGRQNAWKRWGKAWLRVTYITEKAATVIVTATLTPRGPQRSRK